MKYAFAMGSGAMIYIPSFIKIGSGILKLTGGIHRQHGDPISLLLFFQNNESRLITSFLWSNECGFLDDPAASIFRFEVTMNSEVARLHGVTNRTTRI
jgi:hypothetical protein